MDTNHWRLKPSQAPVGGGAGGAGGGGEPTMDTGDWRTQLPPDSRQRIVNKIMDTLKRHLPVSGQEGLHELKKIAMRFEEKIYTAATSQSDYLRKISLKMLTMETKSQNPIAISLPSNAAGSSNKPPDSASLNSMAQTGHANGGDWQEEVDQEDLVTGRMIGSGSLKDGRYHLDSQPDTQGRLTQAYHTVRTDDSGARIWLWHQRLEHPF